jgi:RNA polymerase primary sigma factor
VLEVGDPSSAEDTPPFDAEELQTLIAEGHERGFLTVETIATGLEDVEVTKEQVQELYAYLDEQGIDVVGVDTGAEEDPEGAEPEVDPADDGRRRK